MFVTFLLGTLRRTKPVLLRKKFKTLNMIECESTA